MWSRATVISCTHPHTHTHTRHPIRRIPDSSTCQTCGGGGGSFLIFIFRHGIPVMDRPTTRPTLAFYIMAGGFENKSRGSFKKWGISSVDDELMMMNNLTTPAPSLSLPLTVELNLFGAPFVIFYGNLASHFGWLTLKRKSLDVCRVCA